MFHSREIEEANMASLLYYPFGVLDTRRKAAQKEFAQWHDFHNKMFNTPIQTYDITLLSNYSIYYQQSVNITSRLGENGNKTNE